MSKKFKGNRPLADIKARLLKNSLSGSVYWEQTRYDEGSDWVNFGFTFDGAEYGILYNGFNGTFMVDVDGEMITERSTQLDGTARYDFLLNLIYKPLEKEAA